MPQRVSFTLCLAVFLQASLLAAYGDDSPGNNSPNVAERWSAKGQGGTPEFERHVMPLLGKLGCANRACHGSFQGQGGLQLSLFASNPAADYKVLVKEERIDLDDPDLSLALMKPLGEDPHEGGVRLKKDSWQHRALRAWIAGGAKWNAKKDSKLLRVELTPREIRTTVAKGKQQATPLRLVAYFSDDTSEDVTALTIFSTNDETIATVDDGGRVRATGSGDTAIVATFAGTVVTTQVLVPFASNGVAKTDFPVNNEVDRFVAAKFDKLNIRPSELCTDDVFLRRASLDIIGTLPTAKEVRSFLADKSPDKRAKLIDQLLARPEYGMYWATKFSDWTGNDNRFTPQPRAKTGWLWHDWLRDKLDRDVPYDEIVGGFITATTREERPLEEVVAEFKTVRDKMKKGFDDGTYASRKTNDMFWQKAGNTRPETIGLQAAYAFLGIRLECAQCHKHPFDRWTQDDFRGFTAFFSVMGRGLPKDVPKELMKKGAQSDFRYREVWVQPSAGVIKQLKARPPRLLGDRDVAYEEGQDPRVALFEWMRSPEVPYLSQAIANRLWGHYFGVGIVSPVDNFNAANPPSNPQLLAWLAKDFIDHKFDLKHLHRTILNSRTYQLSWKPNDNNRLDERNFSHALLKRMPAEVVLDAINQITGGTDRYSASNAPPGVRAINLAPTRLRGGGPEYVLGIFGRPLRTQTCDCERSTETGLAQAMYLLNDSDVNSKLNNPKGRLVKLLKQFPDDRALIEELYLDTLSRFPSDEETQKAIAFVKSFESRAVGMQDILWSLLNVREFIFIH